MEVDIPINALDIAHAYRDMGCLPARPWGNTTMQIERLDNIQHDLEDTAAHLSALSKMLEGHAVYLRHSRHADNLAEIDSIETRLNGLAASILDLRGVASNIAKVA